MSSFKLSSKNGEYAPYCDAAFDTTLNKQVSVIGKVSHDREDNTPVYICKDEEHLYLQVYYNLERFGYYGD